MMTFGSKINGLNIYS